MVDTFGTANVAEEKSPKSFENFKLTPTKASSKPSICASQSTRLPLPTVTSAAPARASLGRKSTAPTAFAKLRPLLRKWLREANSRFVFYRGAETVSVCCHSESSEESAPA
jgi:hypothetical protein